MRSFPVKLAVTAGAVAGAVIGSGCSLIYNPSNLPAAADAAPDAPVVEDVDPRLLALRDVQPSTILEGTGAGGSRPAVIVIYGDHMVKEGATVELKPAAGTTPAVVPTLMLDAAQLDVERNGHRLAVPVTVPVDAGFKSMNGEVAFDITVTQPTPDGPRSVTLPGKLVVRGLDELTDTNLATEISGGVFQYSQISVTKPVKGKRIVGDAESSQPIILRSTSSVSITGTSPTSVAALDQDAGPGGGRGGEGGAGLSEPGKPGKGPSPGTQSSEPGDFDERDPWLSTLEPPNRGSGGAGGQASLVGILIRGGKGGGGGGTIEISAGGDLTIGDVSAVGGRGGTPSGAGVGGGGSGGVILLRAGGTLEAGALDVSGGGEGSGASVGKAGRVRYDSGKRPKVPGGTFGLSRHQGAMVAEAPLITRARQPRITVRGEPFSTYRYFITGESMETRGPFEGTIDQETATFELERLEDGLNQVCFVAPGAQPTSPTRNCFDIALMFDPLQP